MICWEEPVSTVQAECVEAIYLVLPRVLGPENPISHSDYYAILSYTYQLALT